MSFTLYGTPITDCEQPAMLEHMDLGAPRIAVQIVTGSSGSATPSTDGAKMAVLRGTPELRVTQVIAR